MEIRKATFDDLDQLLALIHCTSKHLIEKNIYQWNDPCEKNDLKKEIERDEVYLLVDKNRLLGSYSIRPSNQKYPVQIEKSYYMHRLLIHPFFHGKDMATYIFKHVRKQYNKHETVLLDCWAGNEKIFDFYRRHECNFIGDFPEADYKISIFQVGRG